MILFGPVVYSLVLSLISSAPVRIENAFLGGDAEALRPILEPGGVLSLSVSGPIAFSDVLSDEQTVLWFRKFFRSSKTIGFYPESSAGLNFNREGFVFKARWEVQAGSGKPLAYDVFFLIRNRFAATSRRGPAGVGFRGIWTILQIRAEER